MTLVIDIMDMDLTLGLGMMDLGLGLVDVVEVDEVEGIIIETTEELNIVNELVNSSCGISEFDLENTILSDVVPCGLLN